jgi:AraC-like DNA-binding protein
MAMLGEGFAHNPRTLLHIAPYLRSRSIDPIEMFRRAGISPTALLDANGWVPRELCFQLGNELYAATGERFPGAAVGRCFKLTELGTWGVAVSEARTLREACQTAANGIGLVHQGTDLQFRTNGRFATLGLTFLGRSGVDPCQHVLGALAVLRSVALLAGAPEAIGAQFTQPYERAGEHLEDTFGPSLQFGCARDAVVIDREILDLPIAMLGPGTNGADPVETAANLGAFVKKMLPYGGVSVDHVAAHLRMSTRTLQRRLRDFGFSFEEIVDDVRRVEAIRRVATGDSSAIEIAFMLGYSDQAHFSRAFRRWTSMAPRDYARRV